MVNNALVKLWVSFGVFFYGRLSHQCCGSMLSIIVLKLLTIHEWKDPNPYHNREYICKVHIHVVILQIGFSGIDLNINVLSNGSTNFQANKCGSKPSPFQSIPTPCIYVECVKLKLSESSFSHTECWWHVFVFILTYIQITCSLLLTQSLCKSNSILGLLISHSFFKQHNTNVLT